jgi:hypothetical protein
MLISRILNLLLKFKKKKESPSILEEEFIGYEAFPSGYRDNLLKNKQDDSKFCGKS